MSYLDVSDSFEYLCYGSTAIINSFTLYSAGIDFSRQILTTKVYPRAVRVNPYSADSFEQCYGPTAILIFFFLQCGDLLYTSESDVYRRHILTYKNRTR